MNIKYCFIAFICICSILLSCDPQEAFDPENRARWSVKNSTDKDVLCVLSPTAFNNYAGAWIAPNETKVLYMCPISKLAVNPNVTFDRFFTDGGIIRRAVVADSLSNLKKWELVNKDLPGRQFFNEIFWTKRTYKEDGYRYTEWTFELLPEDISQ